MIDNFHARAMRTEATITHACEAAANFLDKSVSVVEKPSNYIPLASSITTGLNAAYRIWFNGDDSKADIKAMETETTEAIKQAAATNSESTEESNKKRDIKNKLKSARTKIRTVKVKRLDRKNKPSGKLSFCKAAITSATNASLAATTGFQYGGIYGAGGAAAGSVILDCRRSRNASAANDKVIQTALEKEALIDSQAKVYGVSLDETATLQGNNITVSDTLLEESGMTSGQKFDIVFENGKLILTPKDDVKVDTDNK